MRLKNLGLVTNAIKSIGQGATDFNKVSNAVRTLSVDTTMAVLKTTKLSDTEKVAILVSKDVSQAKAEELVANASLSASTDVLTSKTMSLKAALKGLKATMMANPLTAIITIATAVISIVSQVTSKIKEAEENLKQKVEEINSTYQEQKKTLQSTKETLDDIIDRYKELSDGADSLLVCPTKIMTSIIIVL